MYKFQLNKIDHTNTLKGTAELRRQRSQAEWSCTACTSLNKASDSRCSVCSTNRMAGREVISVDNNDRTSTGPRDHRAGVNGSFATLNQTSSSSSSSNSRGNSNSGRYSNGNNNNNNNYNDQRGGDVSICPFCSRRFNDPVDLIQHCEAVHPDNSNGSRPTPKKKGKKCICS